MTTLQPAVPTDAHRPSPDDPRWELRLYVAGKSPMSLRAIANLQRLCEEQFAGQYHIEVIDLTQHPQLAKRDEILALPTLVRKLPPPVRKIIGDLSDRDKVLVGLQILSDPDS